MVRVAYDGPDAAEADGTGDGKGESVAAQSLRKAKTVEYEQIVLEQEQQDGSETQESLWFCAFVGTSVFTNVQVVALETDYGCASFSCAVGDRMPWYLFDHVFTLLFLLDVGLSMWRVGPKKYFRGEPGLHRLGFNAFNCVDVLVVLLRVVDVWALSPAGIETGLRLVSLLRIVHITRFVRAVRLVPAFRELWLVVAGMGDTIRVVSWVAVLLVLLLWVFATLVTIAVSDSDATTFDFRQAVWTKAEYWGDVPRSMYSLFQVFTGDKWSSSLAWPLIKRYPWLVVIFVAFRVAAILALMNVIVGVIVETTLSSARANEEARDKDQKRKDAIVMESLREIFREADTDGSGELDREELEALVRMPAVRDRMRMLEVPVKELELLHGLLDATGSGLIETDAFFRGCARLRGPAMSVDLHQMSVDLDRHVALAEAHIARAGKANDALSDLLDCVEGLDVEVIKGDADEKDPVLVARRGRERQSKARILRSANWVDNRAPQFLVADNSRPPSKQNLGRPSLVRAALKASSVEERAPPRAAGPGVAFARPDAPPPPPPMPTRRTTSRGRSSSRGRPSSRGF